MGRKLVEPIADELPRLKMTYEEFLAWADEDTRAEWIDGEVVVFMPATELHQLVVSLFFELLKRYVGLFHLGVVIPAPYEMRLGGIGSFEPDVVFISRSHFDRRTPERLEGPADFVMEALSDSTATYMRRVKLPAFDLGGVPEIWMVDPRPGRQPVEPYARSEDGRLLPIAPDEVGRYHSVVLPGFWFDPSWLLRRPLPDVDDLLAAIAPDALGAHLERLLGSLRAGRSGKPASSNE
jgi:Uma2 family endonuclease